MENNVKSKCGGNLDLCHYAFSENCYTFFTLGTIDRGMLLLRTEHSLFEWGFEFCILQPHKNCHRGQFRHDSDRFSFRGGQQTVLIVSEMQEQI